jgi:hypothetical protein
MNTSLLFAFMAAGSLGIASAQAQSGPEEPIVPLFNPPAAVVSDQTARVVQRLPAPADDPLEALGNAFDVQEDERPWSTTTSIRLQAKQGDGIGQWVPFLSVAREVGSVEDRERLGIGGGLAYYFAPNASFASELLYFGDRGNSNNAWERETRITLAFRIDF